VDGYSGPKYKKFNTRKEAEYFAEHGKVLTESVKKDPALPMNFDEMLIFTDGSWSSKTQKSAASVVFSHPYEAYTHVEQLPIGTTNQLAELYAIARAIDIFNEQITKTHHITAATLWTDSDYAVKATNLWCKSWVKNGWLTSSGEPVKYQYYIKYIIENQGSLRIRHLKEVNLKSHQSEPSDPIQRVIWQGNKEADHLARRLTI
jgi:ribonuclease HI